MTNIRGPELLVLVLVIVLLFGATRLPDAARSVGRSLRIFKAETKGLTDSQEPAQPESDQRESGQPGLSAQSTPAQSTPAQPTPAQPTPARPDTPPAPPAPPSRA
jgi:sec-independent protein translocase protein TatA